MTYRAGPHDALVRETLMALSAVGVFAWHHPTGFAVTKSGAKIHYGLKGSSDIIGMLPPNGRFLGFECKTGEAEPEEQQDKFRDRVLACGGVYVVVRRVEDAIEAVARIRGKP